MYDPTNPPRLLRQSGIEGLSVGAKGLSEWGWDTTDDVPSVVAVTPEYFSNARAMRMQPGDIIWIRNSTNNRLWRATLASISPNGAGSLGDFGTQDIGQESAVEAGWNALAQSSNGAMVRFTPGAWPVISVAGTFAGASVSLQGSNDGGITWTNLSPPALTAAGTFKALQAGEIYQYGRPVVTGGTGSTALAVTF
jgi:hypothetical protein